MKKTKRAVIANPDKKDLSFTAELFNATGLIDRCELRGAAIDELVEEAESFDTVVCISVLEHIPIEHALSATIKLWSLVKPGGTLLVSVPCAKDGFDEYINYNEYGFLQADKNGFVFGQRFYDKKMINDYLFSVTGVPVRMSIFGENVNGIFFKDREQKLCNPNYPYWNQSLLIATQFRYYNDINSLPGVGVIAFEFYKK